VIILRAPWAFIRLLFQSVILALGQIWANKTRSVLTTIGIVIGIASVIAVVAGLTGLKAKILKDFETVGTKRIMISAENPSSGPLRFASYDRIELRPEQLEGILEHCPSVEVIGRRVWLPEEVTRGEKRLEAVDIFGIDPAWHKIENRSVTVGRPFSLLDGQQKKQVCLITPDVREKLLLDRECVGQSLLIGNRTFLIVGVVEPPVQFAVFGGGGPTPSEVFIPFETGYPFQRWMGADALAKSPEVVDDAKAEITFFLRQSRKVRPGEPDTFGVETIKQYLDTFNGIALAATAVASGVVGVSLLVGGIGVMNIMLVSVSERTREIGLRKAVGARPSAILLQFLVEAVVLCLVGGALGLGAGQLLTYAMKQIPHSGLDTAAIPAWAVLLSFAFTSSIGLFFGMFPAVKAARLDPIEALRHE